MRAKRSIVWKLPDKEFISMIRSSRSVGDMCQKLNGRPSGCMFNNIKERIKQLNIDTSHFLDRRKKNLSFHYVSKECFLKRLTKNSYRDTKSLKKKLLEFGLVSNKCSECGHGDLWNNKPLTFQIDHIDGDFKNNQLSNLRLLCPNCHSQTSTFSIGTRKKKTFHCNDCKRETSGCGKLCASCASSKHQMCKRDVPPANKEDLKILVGTIPLTEIARKYHVSDNAVRKWCKKFGINCEFGRGYWSKN